MSFVFIFCIQVCGYFQKSSTNYPLAYALTIPDLPKWCNGVRDRLILCLPAHTVLHYGRSVIMRYELCAHRILQPSFGNKLGSTPPHRPPLCPCSFA